MLESFFPILEFGRPQRWTNREMLEGFCMFSTQGANDGNFLLITRPIKPFAGGFANGTLWEF